MSLGSLSRSQSLGRLVYETGALDDNVLNPARLKMADGSDPKTILKDSSGNLGQIEMNRNIVDIVGGLDALTAKVYGSSQIVGFDNTSGV